MSICVNITAGLENLIVWHKSLTTYREGDVVCIESNNVHPYMVNKGGGGDIGVQVVVTDGVDNSF